MFPELSVGLESFTTADDAPAEAVAVVEFWQEAGPDLWFAKDAEFDRLFHARFLPWHEKAARDELTGWRHSTCGALALLVLLDQFPRNAFRGTPRMYVTDPLARAEAEMAVAAGHDRRVEKKKSTGRSSRCSSCCSSIPHGYHCPDAAKRRNGRLHEG